MRNASMDDPCLPAGQRIYAIGDVHGCYDEFSRLIRLIRLDNADRPRARVRLVLLGDLIDSGPNPARMVENCMQIARANADFVVLRGSREQTMLDALDGRLDALGSWIGSGGDATLRDWGVSDDLLDGHDLPALLAEARKRVPKSVLNWLKSLNFTLQVGNNLFVHAGIRPGFPMGFQLIKDWLWIGDEFLSSDDDHGVMVVHGHTMSANAPDIRHNRIGIDAGVSETGRLIALGLERNERWIIDVDQASPLSTAA